MSPSDAATSRIIAIRTSLTPVRSRNPFCSVRAYEPAMLDRISQPDVRAERREGSQTLLHLKIGKRNSAGRKSDSTRRFDVGVRELAGKLKTNLRSRAFGNLNSRRDFLIDEKVKDELRTFVSFVYFDVYYDKWRLY